MALMKPTTINLAGNKADSSLVNMAFKIADAATPADMSNIFARMADSYDRTMRGNAAMWASIGKAVEPFIEEAASNYGEFMRYKTRADQSHFNSPNGNNVFLNGGKETIKNPEFDHSTVDGGFMKREQAGPLEGALQNLPSTASEVPTFEEWVKEDPISRQGATQEDYKEAMTAFPKPSDLDLNEDALQQLDSSKKELPKNMRVDTNGNPEFITKRTLGLNDISRALRETWNPARGNPFSRENKQKRMQIQARKEQIFADIDLLEAGFNGLAKKMGSNDYYRDAFYTDSGSTRLLNAIGTLHNPSGRTRDGDYVQPGYDSEQRLVLRLFDKDGNAVLKNKKNPNSEQISIRANDLNSIVIPKLDRKGKEPFNKMWQDYIKTLSRPNANAEEESNGFVNNMRDLVADKEKLHQAMHEKHFLNFQTSFVDDLMGTNGKRADLSATLFQALMDTNGATNGKPNLPTDTKGNAIDIDISGGSDPNALDEMDFSGDGVGLQNYAKIASALTNRNSEFYNEDTTRGVFLHWAKEKGMEKARIALGKTPEVKVPGKGTAMALDTDSSVVLNNIIKAAKEGFPGTLSLPKKSTYGSRGSIKWNHGKGYFEIHQDNKVTPLTGVRDIRTNRGLELLMLEYGVFDRHVLQYAKAGMFKSPVFNLNKFKQIHGNAQSLPSNYIKRPQATEGQVDTLLDSRVTVTAPTTSNLTPEQQQYLDEQLNNL